MKNGYVAISSVLVITVVVLILGTTAALLSVNEIQSALSQRKSYDTLGFVESCVEDALLWLNETNSIPGTVTTPDGNCTVTINSQSGTSWDFTVTGNKDTYTKAIRITATRTTALSVTSWVQQ